MIHLSFFDNTCADDALLLTCCIPFWIRFFSSSMKTCFRYFKIVVHVCCKSLSQKGTKYYCCFALIKTKKKHTKKEIVTYVFIALMLIDNTQPLCIMNQMCLTFSFKNHSSPTIVILTSRCLQVSNVQSKRWK